MVYVEIGQGARQTAAVERPVERAVAVRFDNDTMWVELSDGRTLGVPQAWFPRLLHATPEQRERVEIGHFGLHWEELDEDIGIAGILAGRGDRTQWGRRERKRVRTWSW